MSDDAIKTAEHGWNLLRLGESKSTGLEISTVRTDVPAAGDVVRFALDDRENPRLLLPLTTSEIPDDPVGAPALNIEISTFLSGGRSIRFLDLTCLSANLESVFAEVVNEIIARIASGTGCLEAAQTAMDDFRALLARPSWAAVTNSMIAGLVGELLVLDRLLDRSDRAWQCWRGPVGDRHDFRNRNFSLEVKSSTRAGRRSIFINGFEQLEAPKDDGALYLFHLVLEPVAAGEFNIATLGRRIRTKASHTSQVDKLLAAVGCDDVNDDAWNRLAFRFETETLYEVENGFPRLVPSMLEKGHCPAGVSEVNYRIDLSMAEGFIRKNPGFDGIVEELTKCL